MSRGKYDDDGFKDVDGNGSVRKMLLRLGKHDSQAIWNMITCFADFSSHLSSEEKINTFL